MSNLIDTLDRDMAKCLTGIRAGRAELFLFSLRLAGKVILDTNDPLPPIQRRRVVEGSCETLLELRAQVASEPWLTDQPELLEPISCIDELIDMARDQMAGKDSDMVKPQ